MRRMVTVLAAVASLTGCELLGSGGDADSGTATPTPTPTVSESPIAAPSPTGAQHVAEETELYLFEYAWPEAAGKQPELAALLDQRMDHTKEQLVRESTAARASARQDGFPYNKHSYSADWKVVTELPGWLSLSSQVATYSGGAHGMYGVDALLWNKVDKTAMSGIDLFTSPADLEKAVHDRFCDQLNKQREKKRGEPIAADSTDEFDKCPGIDELVVLVGSSNRKVFNRLTFYAGPYVAGPYVEGAYEVDLPVDAAVLATVKPEYQGFFAARN
ncbi:DUF4163 domain-containing protein [Altererythrobacter xixiisoli]|uniref:DUF4163 domain-containing protein n=1 Tax=Croceibacterium xixiisoli TaxID=1476466 RepID=A0A6I4TQN0_9SPHN|nr:DUF4163 domain-containing protein [Croceibacterium xixiisoli]MXO98174.1 DUF4163 domain-containing protein [Croceibacterium xixiisoli]